MSFFFLIIRGIADSYRDDKELTKCPMSFRLWSTLLQIFYALGPFPPFIAIKAIKRATEYPYVYRKRTLPSGARTYIYLYSTFDESRSKVILGI